MLYKKKSYGLLVMAMEVSILRYLHDNKKILIPTLQNEAAVYYTFILWMFLIYLYTYEKIQNLSESILFYDS